MGERMIQAVRSAVERTEARPIRFGDFHYAQLKCLISCLPDNESRLAWPDAGPVELGFEGVEQTSIAILLAIVRRGGSSKLTCPKY